MSSFDVIIFSNRLTFEVSQDELTCYKKVDQNQVLRLTAFFHLSCVSLLKFPSVYLKDFDNHFELSEVDDFCFQLDVNIDHVRFGFI